jgi:hypothetical protein
MGIPDTAFYVNPIRIQGFDDQILNVKRAAESFSFFFWIKNCNLLITRPP